MQNHPLETPPAKAAGRPPFKPTLQLCDLVQDMSARGIPHDKIAKFIHITAPTLRKHFRRQLNHYKPSLKRAA